MIGYLDTSAVVPLLVEEPSSKACRRFWDDADTVVSSRLLYVEAAAALAQARRMGRLTVAAHDISLSLLDRLYAEIDLVEVDELVVLRAAELAYTCQLRGYDALHCASALMINDDDVVACAGDRQLLSAWTRLRVSVYDPNA